MKVTNRIIILGLLMSCNSQQEASVNKDLPASEVKATATNNCYQYATAADTIALKITHQGDSITGTLVYKLKEKDSNNGTIRGVMKNNVLIADYTFMSEGIQSVRQVAFKSEGNSFIEGYGDGIDQDGKFMFKNSDSLTFSSSIKLSEVVCQ